MGLPGFGNLTSSKLIQKYVIIVIMLQKKTEKVLITRGEKVKLFLAQDHDLQILP